MERWNQRNNREPSNLFLDTVQFIFIFRGVTLDSSFLFFFFFFITRHIGNGAFCNERNKKIGKRMLILRGYEFSIVQIAFDIKFEERRQRALRNFANNYLKPWNYNYTIVRRLNMNNINLFLVKKNSRLSVRYTNYYLTTWKMYVRMIREKLKRKNWNNCVYIISVSFWITVKKYNN